MASKRDYYEVLSVSRDADGETIKKAFRRLAMECHPDRNPGDEQAAERFKEISEAAEVLCDPHKRAIYDAHGHAGLNGMGAGGFGAQEIDLSELFGDLLGQFFGGGSGRRRQRSGPRAGRDIQAIVDIELKDAARGCKRIVQIQREEHCELCRGSGSKPGTRMASCQRCGGQGVIVQRQGFFQVQSTCPACGGRGMINPNPCEACRGSGRIHARRSLELEIPPGVDSGDRIRLQGQGDAGDPGGPRGDLELVVRVQEHRFYKRDGHNLICEWPITFSQAALGGPLEIRTLTGEKVRVDLPRGIQTHEVLRMPNHGMPLRRNPSRRGDLLIHVIVDTPQNLSPEQEELFRKLAELEQKQVHAPPKSIFSKLRDWLTSDDSK